MSITAIVNVLEWEFHRFHILTALIVIWVAHCTGL